MITFRLGGHAFRDTQTVEIVGPDGDLLGVLYPQDWGVRVVSKYLREDSIKFDPVPPCALNVKLP